MHHRRRLPARLRGNEPRIIDEPRTDPRRSKGLSRGLITAPGYLARGHLAHSAEFRRRYAMARPGCAVEVNHKTGHAVGFRLRLRRSELGAVGFRPHRCGPSARLYLAYIRRSIPIGEKRDLFIQNRILSNQMFAYEPSNEILQPQMSFRNLADRETKRSLRVNCNERLIMFADSGHYSLTGAAFSQ